MIISNVLTIYVIIDTGDQMKTIDLKPRGYCHGVLNALAMVKKAIRDTSYPRPIYILGQIVHNQKITQAFQSLGVISLDEPGKTRLEMLKPITSGTVIFTAHGVSEQTIQLAKDKGLTYLNATCRDVLKVHKAVKQKLEEGYRVIYIGHKNHPEPEAILAISDDILFVENEKDVLMLPDILNEKIFVTNQTTLSLYDINPVLSMIESRFPNYLFDDKICNATTVRQQAVMHQEDVDLMLVVGDIKSSNANKLKEVAKQSKQIPAYLITGVEDIDLSWLASADRVSVTSGASTPTSVTNEVIAFLEQYKKDDPNTWDHQTTLQIEDII